MITGFISSIRFLTTIPVPICRQSGFTPQAAVQFFPLTGLMIGVIIAALDALFGIIFNQRFGTIIPDALDVACLIMLTGALHIDGLADSADGLFSHKDKTRILDIMRDSRIGSMGAVTVITVMLLKFAGLTGIEAPFWHRFILIALVPAFARTGAVFAMSSLPYLRATDGLAKDFIPKAPPFLAVVLLAVLIFLAAITGAAGLYVILVFGLSTLGMIYFYKKRLGGFTGDMLGAMIEVQEALLFLAAAISL